MPNLREYRRRFAKHVGSGLLAGTAASGSTSTYLYDPTRRSALAVGDDLVEWYLYRPDAAQLPDRVRLVGQVDLEAGRIFGDFAPGDQWAVPPAPTEVYELISPEFAPDQLHDFINETLKFCLVPAEVTIPRVPLPGARQPVTGFVPWLTNGQQLYRVGALSGQASREVTDPYLHHLRGTVEETGGGVSLRLDGGGLPAAAVTVGTLTASPLSPVLTTLYDSNLIPGANWPTTYPFYVTIDTELLQVTARVTTPFPGYTLVRGIQSTAANHLPGAVVYAPSQLVLHGLFPAYGLCRPAGGVYGAQMGLTLDTDEAIPEAQWVVAGALKEAWLTSPQTLEQMAERMRLANLEQATLAFQRWQETMTRRMGVVRTFAPLHASIFNVSGSVR